ncbi:uncharacterized protein LOC126896001 isoform X5 [Daktulosphaira vitifoliae]|uniref:uncharacterized protein LOC126896001 isoform X3 n=1 Tax=Daktulosphaira vitifoliae TaxID=58002 RepID=UPI0021AA73F7|nr:uncharacterized protein LOC126896001 isoform X3 [Daktulosphaira vitifoliae]XP_050524352.1 uncharacterized protein LOC126896001 isoform X4 [Daktulosphaira vitifoliae]XP_050524353.1 uncharacterized protein LOC126896001 isoform X5 [Daktulosphaira vitifoliae]
MIYTFKILLIVSYTVSALCAPNGFNCGSSSSKEQNENPNNNEDTPKEYDDTPVNDSVSVIQIVGAQMKSILLLSKINDSNEIIYKDFVEAIRLIMDFDIKATMSDSDYKNIENSVEKIDNLMEFFYNEYSYTMWKLNRMLKSSQCNGAILVNEVRRIFSLYNLDTNIQDRILKRLVIQNDCVIYDDIIKHLL